MRIIRFSNAEEFINKTKGRKICVVNIGNGNTLWARASYFIPIKLSDEDDIIGHYHDNSITEFPIRLTERYAWAYYERIYITKE